MKCDITKIISTFCLDGKSSMLRYVATICFMCVTSGAWAIEPPQAQILVTPPMVLHGHFNQEHVGNATEPPLRSEGHFVLAPSHGLIWGLEQPFPTSTIITETGASQVVGTFVMKLPAKNIRHLYEMVSAALAGNWNKLEEDFTITQSVAGKHWQMLLVPHNTDKPTLSYASIKVDGSQYLDSIVMTKADGSADKLTFSAVTPAARSLSGEESALFAQVARP